MQTVQKYISLAYLFAVNYDTYFLVRSTESDRFKLSFCTLLVWHELMCRIQAFHLSWSVKCIDEFRSKEFSFTFIVLWKVKYNSWTVAVCVFPALWPFATTGMNHPLSKINKRSSVIFTWRNYWMVTLHASTRHGEDSKRHHKRHHSATSRKCLHFLILYKILFTIYLQFWTSASIYLY